MTIAYDVRTDVFGQRWKIDAGLASEGQGRCGNRLDIFQTLVDLRRFIL